MLASHTFRVKRIKASVSLIERDGKFFISYYPNSAEVVIPFECLYMHLAGVSDPGVREALGEVLSIIFNAYNKVKR